jgi:hypothetical protein
MQYKIGKLSSRATTLLWSTLTSKFILRNYELTNCMIHEVLAILRLPLENFGHFNVILVTNHRTYHKEENDDSSYIWVV